MRCRDRTGRGDCAKICQPRHRDIPRGAADCRRGAHLNSAPVMRSAVRRTPPSVSGREVAANDVRSGSFSSEQPIPTHLYQRHSGELTPGLPGQPPVHLYQCKPRLSGCTRWSTNCGRTNEIGATGHYGRGLSHLSVMIAGFSAKRTQACSAVAAIAASSRLRLVFNRIRRKVYRCVCAVSVLCLCCVCAVSVLCLCCVCALSVARPCFAKPREWFAQCFDSHSRRTQWVLNRHDRKFWHIILSRFPDRLPLPAGIGESLRSYPIFFCDCCSSCQCRTAPCPLGHTVDLACLEGRCRILLRRPVYGDRKLVERSRHISNSRPRAAHSTKASTLLCMGFCSLMA